MELKDIRVDGSEHTLKVWAFAEGYIELVEAWQTLRYLLIGIYQLFERLAIIMSNLLWTCGQLG